MDLLILTLDRLADRQTVIAARLAALGVAFTFFKGMDGSRGEHQPVSKYDEIACLRRFAAPLRQGEIACFASHYLMWRECRDRGIPLAIMEDDVTPLPTLPEALEVAATRVAEHRFIRLDGLRWRPYRVLEDLGAFRLVRFLKGPTGTQCYCLSPEGASALLSAADRWVEPVDGFIDAFWRHGVESKALIPFSAHSDDASHRTSTIGARKAVRHGWARARREAARLGDETARVLYNLTHR